MSETILVSEHPKIPNFYEEFFGFQRLAQTKQLIQEYIKKLIC